MGAARWSTSCAFLDVARDGDLDLFVANYLDAAKNDNRFSSYVLGIVNSAAFRMAKPEAPKPLNTDVDGR